MVLGTSREVPKTTFAFCLLTLNSSLLDFYCSLLTLNYSLYSLRRYLSLVKALFFKQEQ